MTSTAHTVGLSKQPLALPFMGLVNGVLIKACVLRGGSCADLHCVGSCYALLLQRMLYSAVLEHTQTHVATSRAKGMLWLADTKQTLRPLQLKLLRVRLQSAVQS